jgi:hypothetical protein
MGLFSFFNKESRLEDLLTGVEKLDLGDYLDTIDGYHPYLSYSSLRYYQREAYIYHGYLVILCKSRLLSRESEYKYYIHEFVETSNIEATDLDRISYGVRHLKAEELVVDSREQVFLAACKRVDDIILANEGF